MNVQSRVICKQPGRYIGWPGLAKAPEGDLLAVFSGDRDAHVCPYGKMYFMKSRDDGETWTEPRIIMNSPVDDRDPALLACSDGTLIANWFTLYIDGDYARRNALSEEMFEQWQRDTRAIPDADRDYWTRPDLIERSNGLRGHWLMRSIDGGVTWMEPQRVIPSTTSSAFECADGRILYIGNASMKRDDRSGYVSVIESSDAGASWREIAQIDMFTGYAENHGGGVSYICEIHAIETDPGRILAVARHEMYGQPAVPDVTRIWSFVSEDGGRTWSEPEPTDVVGKPPHLTRLDDGRILMSYGYRYPPYGQRACISDDGGRTWDHSHEIIIRDDGSSGDLGYPQSVQCGDGRICTVYYQIDKPGEKPSLTMSRWDLP